MRFPDTLPNPSVGMTIEFKGSHREQKFDGGRRIVRQVRARPNILPISWEVSDQQRQELEVFHRAAGATYFLMSLESPKGWIDQQVRFADQLSLSYVSKDAWKCSSKLLLMQPIYLTPDELETELIDMLGDWDDLSFADDIHKLVNITLPDIYG